MTYKPKTDYTESELLSALIQDLVTDAESAELQAETGPFYPERGITRESLLQYAAECRVAIQTRDISNLGREAP